MILSFLCIFDRCYERKETHNAYISCKSSKRFGKCLVLDCILLLLNNYCQRLSRKQTNGWIKDKRVCAGGDFVNPCRCAGGLDLATQAGIWDLGSGVSWAETHTEQNECRQRCYFSPSRAREQSGFLITADLLEDGQRHTQTDTTGLNASIADHSAHATVSHEMPLYATADIIIAHILGRKAFFVCQGEIYFLFKGKSNNNIT